MDQHTPTDGSDSPAESTDGWIEAVGPDPEVYPHRDRRLEEWGRRNNEPYAAYHAAQEDKRRPALPSSRALVLGLWAAGCLCWAVAVGSVIFGPTSDLLLFGGIGVGVLFLLPAQVDLRTMRKHSYADGGTLFRPGRG
jgi:hypothetical protein